MYRTQGYPIDLKARSSWRERPRRGIREVVRRLFHRG